MDDSAEFQRRRRTPLVRATLCGELAEPGTQLKVAPPSEKRERTMHGIIYLVGLIVVIMAILSFFGLR